MEESRKYVSERAPKNKKQIGKIGKGDKIYIEDYAVTYLNQVARTSSEGNGFAGLFGTCREIEGVKEYYIYAAIYQPADKILEGGMPREAVQKIMRLRAELFTEYFFLGWALVLRESGGTMWESCYRSRLETLMGKPEVLMTLRCNTCEEHFYLYPTEMPKEVEGYFIFYEQNDAMQNFLIDWHGENNTDKCDGDSDYLAESCRNYYKEKKAAKFRNRLAATVLAAMVLLLIFGIGAGINQINEYGELQVIQQTVGQVVQESIDCDSEIAEVVVEEQEELPVSDMEYIELEQPSVSDTEYIELEQPSLSDTEYMETEQPEEMITNHQEEITENIEEHRNQAEEVLQEVVLQEPQIEEYVEYEVARGDTLYGICLKFYGNLEKAREICSLNDIENMDNILYGEKILLPQ